MNVVLVLQDLARAAESGDKDGGCVAWALVRPEGLDCVPG